MFKLFDREGQPLPWEFKTRLIALQYAAGVGRPDWSVKEVRKEHIRKSTERQRSAVHFCEQFLHVKFDGNLNDFYDVSEFLSEYLDDAKNLYDEIACEYEAYLADLD